MGKQRDFGPHQLAEWLGLTPRQVRRAQARGLIPPPDVDDERWSEAVAKTLPDRLEEIEAAVSAPSSAAGTSGTSGAEQEPEQRKGAEREPRAGRRGRTFGPIQLAGWLGLEAWQVSRAVQRGLIPAPDVDDRRWSEAAARPLAERVEEVLAAVGDHPGLGSTKAAEHLAERTGLAVEREDVRALAARGVLEPVGEFRGHPMYGLAILDALPAETVASVVREREEWVAQSFTAKEAAAFLGWPLGKFEVTAERRGLRPGPLQRFARADVAGLSA